MYYLKEGTWQEAYGETISIDAKNRIFSAFNMAIEETKEFTPPTMYGERIEDRGAEITFSGCGQDAPLDVKTAWDPDATKRQEIIRHLTKYLPEGFQARIGGTTSIDVTKRIINYAYGINKMMTYLNFRIEEVLFIGNVQTEGGNAHLVKSEGFECADVKNPEETKVLLKRIVAIRPVPPKDTLKAP
jgi:hypothetical protein